MEHGQRKELFRIAAEMAMGKNMPSPYMSDWNFPKNLSRKKRKEIPTILNGANEQCRKWAIELRAVIDSDKSGGRPTYR